MVAQVWRYNPRPLRYCITRRSGLGAHGPPILAGVSYMMIVYPRGPIGSMSWFTSLMMLCTAIGFSCMTILGLLWN